MDKDSFMKDDSYKEHVVYRICVKVTDPSQFDADQYIVYGLYQLALNA